MGTSQKIIPGVTGQPNWGDLSKSVTQIAKTVEKEREIEGQYEGSETDSSELDKLFQNLFKKRKAYLSSTYDNLVKSSGGKDSVTRGKSKSLGNAGLKSSRKLVGFIVNVSSKGLQEALTDIGFGSLIGKSLNEVLDYLLVYCTDNNTGMDETAANKASCEIFDMLAAQSRNDLNSFEELLKNSVDVKGLSEILCAYWGFYIFEHLSQKFKEKITKDRGEKVSRETFKIIKDDIVGRIKVLNLKKPVSKIDWKGAEGEKEISSIFESIIKILCDESRN
jgi:hypothetical protein